MWEGVVVSIHLAPAAGAAPTPVEAARAVPGKGLEGDRYFAGAGTYSRLAGTGRALTLIEDEALEALLDEGGIELAPGASRRNVVTRGVPLNHLVNREFYVGAVRLRGMRLCEPCAYLERLTQAGVRRALVHRGGLRADIVSEGVIHVGDTVRETP
ncbi:MAG TPA: MOSC domain-containing protein [Chloroflexota bacterium]|nr:MOSC domain-containing protein [Chloroflexota bacterium]